MLASTLRTSHFRRADGEAVEWAVSSGPVDYAHAVGVMEARVADIAQGAARELVWLVEHPPVYTAGVSARPEDLLAPDRFPVVRTGRGGQYTYHGPGQRVAYVMLDLNRRRRDVHAFVGALEAWIVTALAQLGVPAGTRPGRVGVWVDLGEDLKDVDAVTAVKDLGAAEAKIAAIGVKIRRWVSFHGISLNVSPDLEHFSGIVPCGLAQFGVTSLKALGRTSDLAVADQALLRAFDPIFGPAIRGEAPHEP